MLLSQLWLLSTSNRNQISILGFGTSKGYVFSLDVSERQNINIIGRNRAGASVWVKNVEGSNGHVTLVATRRITAFSKQIFWYFSEYRCERRSKSEMAALQNHGVLTLFIPQQTGCQLFFLRSQLYELFCVSRTFFIPLKIQEPLV